MTPAWKTLRFWLLFMCITLGGAILWALLQAESLADVWSIVVFETVVLVVLGVVYTLATVQDHLRPMDERFGDLTLELVDRATLDSFVDRNGLHLLDYPQLLAFVESILFPKAIFERITESVESYHRSSVVRTTFTVTLGRSHRVEEEKEATGTARSRVSLDIQDGTCDFIIPLIVPLKGELLDGLRVFDESDKRISTISAQRQLLFSMAAMRGMVLFLGKRAFDRYVKDVEPDFELMMREVGPLQDPLVEAMLERFRALPAPSDDETMHTNVVDLAKALMLLNPVCVPISVGKTKEKGWPRLFRLGVARRFIASGDDPPARTPADWLADLLDAFRLAFGVRLNRVYVPLLNASRTSSYHLEVAGPPGTYLAKQAILAGEGDVAGLEIDARIQSRRGQRRSHLYIRSLAADNGALFAVQFFERAPGSFLTTTLSSFAAGLVVTVLAFRESTNWLDSTNNLTLLPALLAVPIGVAAVTGIEVSRPTRHASLMSYSLTFLVVAVALAALLAVTVPSDDPAFLRRVWEILVGVAWATFASSVACWMIRLVVEHQFRSQ